MSTPEDAVPAQPSTVRVRIAVAVDPSGKWNAGGWSRDDGSQEDDATMMETCTDFVGPGESRHFIEADVPLPLPPQATMGHVVSSEGE